VPENPSGRGLLDPHELALSAPPEAIPLPVELLDANPRNPRGKLPEVDALAASIKQFGLLQPIFARRVGERYEILGGHRRYAAFRLLAEQEPLEPRWRTIPVRVLAFDDERAYLALIVGQVHTAQWKPREEAAALEELYLRLGTLEKVGQAISRSYPLVSKRLRVYSDSVLSGFVQSGQLSRGVAEEFLILRDLDTRRDFAERAVRESWSQDQARGRVRALRQDLERADVGRLARELHDRLDRLGEGTVSVDAFTELWSLSERIGALWQAAQGKPARRMPSIADAEKAAGVTEKAKARAADAATRRQRAARAKRRAP
jgi:ParB/RepB/Spo0J family partition protein